MKLPKDYNDAIKWLKRYRRRKVANNTYMELGNRGVEFTFHGYVIGRLDYDGTLRVTLAGWPTLSTRRRVNALIDAYGNVGDGVFQRDWKQYVTISRATREIGDNEVITYER